MKYLSRESIESISMRIVSAYKKLPSVQDSEFLNVDPRKLVNDLLGLTLDFCHLSLDGRTLGLTSFGEVGIQVFDGDNEEEVYVLDGKTLLVESNMEKDPAQHGRCNFTIMHEGSHTVATACSRRSWYAAIAAASTVKKCGTQPMPTAR